MRTLAALLAAFPLFAIAQAPAPQPWTTEPPIAAPATTAPAPQTATPAQPDPALPAQPEVQSQPAYAPPPQAASPAQPQYAPPPQAVPAAPTAAAHVRPPKSRDRWYIGFGFGGGDGKIANSSRTETFKEAALDESPTTGFLNFKVGATLSPKLLLGLDVAYVFSGAKAQNVSTSLGVRDVTTTLGIMNFDAMATYFPSGRGFFLKGGFGRSAVARLADASGLGQSDYARGGWNLAGGLGYAWWLGKQFNLSANLDFSRQWYSGSQTTSGPFLLPEISDSQFWSLFLGLDWY